MKASSRIGQSIDSKVFARVHGGRGGKRGAPTRRGRVYTPRDFLDLGPRTAVDKALERAAAAGRLRKLARGLYDDPVLDEQGRPQMPSTEAILRAIIGRDKIRVQPSGAHAANLLHLTEQVPVRLVYLTDGASRTLSVGKRRIVLRQTPPRQMATAGRKSGTVIQALRWLGKRAVDGKTIARLRKQLDSRDRKQLVADARHAPAWIGKIIHDLANGEER